MGKTFITDAVHIGVAKIHAEDMMGLLRNMKENPTVDQCEEVRLLADLIKAEMEGLEDNLYDAAEVRKQNIEWNLHFTMLTNIE